MMVQAQQEQGEGLAIPTDPQHIPTITQPSSSQPQKKHKPRKPKKKDNSIPQSSVPSDNLVDEDVNEENVSKHSNDLLLSGEDYVISSKDEGLGEEDASKQGRKIHDIDEDITLENVHDEDMFGVHDLDGDEVIVENVDVVKTGEETRSMVEEVTAVIEKDKLVNAAEETVKLKSARPKTRGVVMKEPSESITTTTTIPSKDKGKGIMVEEPLNMKKDQISFDKQEAIRLQAHFYKEARIAREKEEANATLIAQWNDIQDKVKTDYELAQRLQAEEQEELTIEEKSKLFVQLLEKRRKHFAAKRVEEKRNKPPTKAQQRSIMTTYLKNMAGWKPKNLKNKSFANIQELFDKAIKRVNIFVDMDTELVKESSKKSNAEIAQESSSKRVVEELESDKLKKQKLDKKVKAEIDDAKEVEELKQCLEIVPDDGDDVTVDATPLSVKMPIVDYKIYQEEKKSIFQIIRADEDRASEYMDTFLHLNLKTMFEHHLEDNVWKNQQGLVKVLNWKLYDSCGVHCVTMQNILYYLLVEKMYPLTKHTLHQMFNDVKLQVDYECEMSYELLRLVKKQLKEGYVPQ
ncbi:hypothetical protein Tco_1046899 [Tanacetum coccineum]